MVKGDTFRQLVFFGPSVYRPYLRSLTDPVWPPGEMGTPPFACTPYILHKLVGLPLAWVIRVRPQQVAYLLGKEGACCSFLPSSDKKIELQSLS